MSNYFVFKNKRWDLIVSKIKSIAYWISQMVPPWKNAGIRGLVFGSKIEDIKAFIKKYREDEIKEN